MIYGVAHEFGPPIMMALELSGVWHQRKLLPLVWYSMQRATRIPDRHLMSQVVFRESSYEGMGNRNSCTTRPPCEQDKRVSARWLEDRAGRTVGSCTEPN